MRTVLFLSLMMILAPGVFAFGIGFPEGLVDGQEFEIGDELDYTFLLRGDSEERDVRFFIRPNVAGIMEFEGVAEYEKNFNVEEYEDILVVIEFDPIGVGDVEVTWGFRYLDSNSSGLAVDQVVSSTIVFEVDGYIPNDDYVLPTASGGSGGGGAYVPPSTAVTPPTRNKAIDVDVDTSTVSELESASSPSPAPTRPSQAALFGVEADAPVSTGATGDGKGSLLLVGFLFVLTAGLSFVSYKAVKGEDDE